MGATGAAVSLPDCVIKAGEPLIKKMSGSAQDSYRGAPPELKKQYYSLRKKYIKAYDELLDSERAPKIDLSKPENLQPVK